MLKLITQSSFSEKLPPRRKKNLELRLREYLSEGEIEQIRKASKSISRYSHRDDTIILIMYRHALRVSEVAALKWEQVNFELGMLHVVRRKNGIPSTHPLKGNEIRALRRLKRENIESRYVFVNERKNPISVRSIHNLVARAGKIAKLPFTIHPHMLRHSTGFYLANKGQDTRSIQSYMGHRNINNTVLYTQLSANRFDSFWMD